jgi:putative flippase GtrA
LKTKLFRELVLFGVAGAIGFVVDAGVLYLLKPFLGLYVGRLFSFFCAALTTWVINRHLTFNQRASGLTLRQEFSRYLGLMLGGGVVNYTSYALLVYFVEFVARQPVWGVAVGSCAGMLVNWLLARLFIFHGKTA